MHISDRTVEDLGWRQIVEALAKRCRTPLGRTRALARPFLDSRDEVLASLERVSAARRLAEQGLAFPFAGTEDVLPSVERADKGGLLEPREILAVAHALNAMERTRAALTEAAGIAPSLAALAASLPHLGELRRSIERCIEPSGEISDRASSDLADARARCRRLHEAIRGRIDKLLHDDGFLVNLREPYFTLRNDRYVLPVLASHQAQVPGIVHNASQTGQTLFVEPQALVGLGNELAIAQSLVAEEERRLLLELSGDVGRELGRIRTGLGAIGELDEVEAAARLSGELGLSTPEVEQPNGSLELHQLRHPLLVLSGKPVVANDLRLSREARALVISGPNAGGKTVTLTALGLAALMLRAGLPIPAQEGSSLPLYRSIHSMVGDAQDLARGLSTFSAHLLALKQTAEAAGHGSLVLIDEIAADTDPREGAALAIATLEDLLTRGATILVTTHLQELKALAHMDPRFVNARVGFDPTTLAPTYRLQLGQAGASSAIEIARRIGLSEEVCRRAEDIARGGEGPLSRALAAAEEERRRLSAELAQSMREREAAETLRAQLEAAAKDREKRHAEEELAHRQAMAEELVRARDEAAELVAAVRRAASLEEAKKAEQELAGRAEAERERMLAAKAASLREEVQAPIELRIGARVRHLGLEQDAEVVSLEGEEAVVAIGPMKVRVPTAQLGPPAKKRVPKSFPGARDRTERALERAEAVSGGNIAATNERCDVRGLRADEALRQVEQFLDRVYRSGDALALIIHGHGSGALRQSIREHLDQSPYVRMFRPGESHEGGNGVTVVALRI